jgi:hypothetical protein
LSLSKTTVNLNQHLYEEAMVKVRAAQEELRLANELAEKLKEVSPRTSYEWGVFASYQGEKVFFATRTVGGISMHSNNPALHPLAVAAFADWLQEAPGETS